MRGTVADGYTGGAAARGRGADVGTVGCTQEQEDEREEEVARTERLALTVYAPPWWSKAHLHPQRTRHYVFVRRRLTGRLTKT
jgi:hypothetical protein